MMHVKLGAAKPTRRFCWCGFSPQRQSRLGC